MSNPNTQGNTKAPKFSQEYEKGLQVYLKYLPQQLQQELGYRQQYDPQLIQQALGMQHQFDPQLAQEQMDALQRRDPQWLAMHQGLGDKIKTALDRGYLDPRQQAAYGQYGDLVSRYAQMAGKGEPTRDATYQALGKQVTGNVLRGRPGKAALHDITQAIQSQRPGLTYGEAQDMATAVYTGQRQQQYQQQAQQAAGQFLQAATPEQQREASLAGAGQALGQFYSQQSPEAQTLAQAGSYLSSPTITSMINQIPGVTPPSNMRYVNPNAGYQGVQFGLQNYQNMLAQQQTQGSSNPWTNALSGAATGANYGSIGGGYGMLGGALTGAIAGGLGYPQFSDIRLKNNLSRTGLTTKDGIPIVEFSYKDSEKRYRGVVAQDVEKVRPDAVFEMDGFKMVDYFKLGLRLEEV